MKPVFLSIIALLLSSSCVSGIEVNQNWDGIKLKAYGSKVDQIDRNKTQIIDLNDDVLYLIFQHIQIIDLINMATAIPEFSPIISNIFRRTYPKELLIFLSYSKYKGRLYQIHNDKLLLTFDLQLCLNILKQFGESFQRILINFIGVRKLDREIVIEFMNKYSSKTLKQLKLDYVEQDLLDHLTVPLEGVEDFTCDIRYSKNVKGPMPWNQLLPKLRRMTLAIFTSANFSFIDCAFPYLEQLSLEIVRTTWDKINVIEGLIRKNPQIKSITLKGTFPAGFAKVIEPLSLNLENLTLSPWEIGDEFVRFENVKFLEVFPGSGYSGSVENIFLPNLELLTMQYNTKSLCAWRTFFKRHTHLRQLILIDPGLGGFVKLNNFTIDLINLVDVTVQTLRYVLDSESIVQFIDSHKMLRRIYFSVAPTKSTDVIQETLRERFQNEWIIKECRQLFTGLCIERKILI